ncbi:hypothetical protein BC829DRAFT_382141, partial [Chytridium lagenaria]
EFPFLSVFCTFYFFFHIWRSLFLLRFLFSLYFRTYFSKLFIAYPTAPSTPTTPTTPPISRSLDYAPASPISLPPQTSSDTGITMVMGVTLNSTPTVTPFPPNNSTYQTPLVGGDEPVLPPPLQPPSRTSSFASRTTTRSTNRSA